MAGKKPPCSLAGGRLWGCDHRVRGGQYVVCELTVLDVWVYGEGGGTRGVGHTPPTAAVGSHQWGNWGMVRYASRSASNPPPLCKIDFTTRPWGTYIYAEEGAPHTGVNLRDKRPCEANRERLSLSQHSPPQRSLAPIVNGLSTDVKLLFFAARFPVCHPVAAARCFGLYSGVAGIWNGITRDGIQSNSIRFNSLSYTNTNGNGICRIFSEYRPIFGDFLQFILEGYIFVWLWPFIWAESTSFNTPTRFW